MTDIVERLREEAECYFNAAWVRQDGGNDYRLSGRLADEAADEIERLHKENQQLSLDYLSSQGQWIEETGRLREALREIEVMAELAHVDAISFAARAALGGEK